MIARAPYLFLLLILVPDLYLDLHYWRHRFAQQRRLLYWLPTVIQLVLTVILTYETHFIPDNITLLYIYLLMMGLITAPKWAYMLCSAAGLALYKARHLHSKKTEKKRKNYGNLVGIAATMLIWYVVLYGAFVGFEKLEVNHQTYTSPDIPKAFDGYKIVLFSDAHVGTMSGNRQWLLQRAVDTMNAQHADMIVFTGDLQNIQPEELLEHKQLLSSLKAKDGVYSVLGNHDYDKYLHSGEEHHQVQRLPELIRLEKQMGWQLLQNEHRTISRGGQHITIAGMENDGDGHKFPQLGNIRKTLAHTNGFIIMLEHEPASWRRTTVPDGRAQLTLSGHTHDMQFRLLGWSPMDMLNIEWNGWYTEGKQSLFVTAGLGGLIPFRFGATGEIVVLKLKKVKR
ncbi:metallophosphoesterase [Prevotella sp. P6B4]|uniref:metallophosphoesterase n=1 Tax=Prevotella sp. P6B4 TaxID=1410614 RepID=UPI00048DFE36|nr:metallophosphoesterase [Prevotella sp. P6B4]